MSSLDLGLVLISALLHAIWNVLAKRSVNPLAFMALLAVAWVILLAPVLVIAPLSQLPPTYWWIVAASAVAHVLYQTWLARAYESADLTVIYPISRSTPAFVALVAVPFMDDPVTLPGLLGIATVMVGIWFVQLGPRLDARAFFRPGVGYAYLTLAATVAYSLVDKLGVQVLDTQSPAVERPALLFFASMAWSTAALLVPYAMSRVPRSVWQQTWRINKMDLLLSAVLGIVSYALILEAMRTSPLSYVTCVRQVSVLFAALLSMRILGERPGAWRLAGSVMVVVGVAAIAFE